MRAFFKIFVLVLMIFVFTPFNVMAHTKEDIINISYNIKTCSSKTKSLIESTRISYTRMLNERNVSSDNINKIYDNINQVINLLNKYNLCSVEQEEQIPQDIKNKLYSLYNEANEIILNSPKIVDEDVTDSKVVIDSSTSEIKIYENGTLSDVIKAEEKLNYVGLNKALVATIVIMVILLVICVMLSIVKKYNLFITALIYALIFTLPVILIFRNELSVIFDMIDFMSVKTTNINKEVVSEGGKIISYPLYGKDFATIYINNQKSDVFFGDSINILKKGIGQSSSSYLPGEGKTTVLSGHNTGFFKELFKLKKNHEIIIETVYGKFTYKVIKTEIVKDTNIDVLKQDYDLIMYTCSPNSSLYGNKRLVVYSKLVNSKWIGDNYET